MPMLIDTAELAGLALEGPLYGIFLCLFLVCGYDLYRRRASKETQLNRPMVVAGVLLMLLSTARFIVDVTYIFVAFIGHDTREARLRFLQDVSRPLFITKHSLFITSLFIGDSFVNYRCWIVWGRNIWIVLPSISFSLISAGSGYAVLWSYSHLSNQQIFAQATLLKSFFSLSLVANFTATLLLAYRIWSVDKDVARNLGSTTTNSSGRSTSASRLRPLMRIVLESGLINAAFLFAFVMTLAFNSLGLEVCSEMGTPLTGIIFSIVIFRVGIRRQNESLFEFTRMSTIAFDPKDTTRRSAPGFALGQTATMMSVADDVAVPSRARGHWHPSGGGYGSQTVLSSVLEIRGGSSESATADGHDSEYPEDALKEEKGSLEDAGWRKESALVSGRPGSGSTMRTMSEDRSPFKFTVPPV